MIRLLDMIKSLMPNFENLPAISSISSFGPGWIFGALGSVAISLFSLSIGRTKAVISLLSIYVAFVVDLIFPYSEQVGRITGGSLEEHWLRIGMFITFYLTVFLIFNLSFIRKKLSSSEYSLFGIMILSIIQLTFLASIIFNILPESLAIKWSFNLYDYIATPMALFFWAVVPLIALLFIRK